MKKDAKTLIFLGIAILALGCAGPKIKEAVDALTPRIDELETKVTEARAIFEIVDGIDAKLEGRVSKTELTKLSSEIENTRVAIEAVVALEENIGTIGDSLAVLDKKAKGDVKTTIAGLNGKISALKATIGEFKSADAELGELKAQIEELQKKPGRKVSVKKKAKPMKKKVK